MKTDIEVIDGAIALIEGDDAWHQGMYCADKHGKPQSIFPKPAKFCLEGAIRYAAGWWHVNDRDHAFDIGQQCLRLENLALKLTGLGPFTCRLAQFNDDESTTQEDAILLLKKTLAELMI